jgi:DNA-binding transcriptional LysR family regulator
LDISWDDIRLFLAAAESDSLSAAARSLQIGQATMSRRIARLEELLGYPLFSRSVDGIALTDAGAAMLAAARTMQDGALAFEAAARGKADELSGRVRFTAAPGIAVDVLAPFAAWLRCEHPNIQLQLLSSVGHLDLARGEADIALRTREPRESELVAVMSRFVKLGVYGSTAYAASLPKRCNLEDIDWVGWAPPYEGLAPEGWIRSLLPDFAPVFAADNFVVQERAVMSGLGAILLPDKQASLVDGLERIKLKPQLEKRLPQARVFVVVAKSAWRSPRVKAVAEAFVEWFDRL